MMRKLRPLSSLVLILALTGQSSSAETTPAKADKPVKLTAKGVEFFESKIRPVLTQRCYSCHSSQAKEVKGGLLLDTRDALLKGGESGAAVVPGDVAESLLIQAIKHETYEMPPGDKLADNVIADFEEWVRMGAPDPRTNKAGATKKVSLAEARDFWSFKRPVRNTIPAVKNGNWPKSEIDSFVLAKLEAKGLQPVADADRVTLIRRLYFDLVGLPPSPSDIDAFVKDQSSEAVSLLVDRLLQAPQFGERWGRHWLDVARYGESTGKERNVAYPYAWRYRDYVIDAFNKDKPYDRFIREQISGDLMQSGSAAERNENLIATGFLAIGTKSLNERNREQYLMDIADEQIDVATRAVLGMTIACARCHDHKFDPVSQTDYYAVAGIFRSTEVLAGVRPGNNKTGYQGDFASLASQQAKLKRTPEQNAEIEKLNGELQDARAMRARLKSLGEQAQGKAKAKGKEQAAQKLAKAAQRMNQRIEQLESQLDQAKDAPAGGGTPVMAVQDSRSPANCKVNIRGEVKDLGPEVPRGIPAVLAFDRSPKFSTDSSGRIQFASWLVSRDNPLTARVMANRVWAHLFGRGIVESVDNFGTLGDEPTNPELLDFLAVRFIENGWSVKTLIKEIVLSRAYQMSADHHEANYALDPDNKLVWRMNRRRLEAEPIRDAILAISGKLDLNRPEGSIVQNAGAMEIGRGKRQPPDLASFLHRSVYLPYVRGRMPEMLTLFDVADPSLIVGQRDITTVAPQALFMMNSPLVMEHATLAAQRVLDQPLKTDDERIDYVYRLIIGRSPTNEQRQRSLEYVANVQKLASESGSSDGMQAAALGSLCQTLIASAEFRYTY